MKTCSKCKTAKDLTEFTKRKVAKDGLNSHCRSCIADARKARYKEYRRTHPLKRVFDHKPLEDKAVRLEGTVIIPIKTIRGTYNVILCETGYQRLLEMEQQGWRLSVGNQNPKGEVKGKPRWTYAQLVRKVGPGKIEMQYLHRFLLGLTKGQKDANGKRLVCDHLNHQTLDNRLDNIRAVTDSQNQKNRAA